MGLCVVNGIERPLKICCVNKVDVLYSYNNRSSSKLKHIDIKFLGVKERIQSQHVLIKHISTNSIVVDLLTKGLLPKVFHEHVAHIGIVLFDNVRE